LIFEIYIVGNYHRIMVVVGNAHPTDTRYKKSHPIIAAFFHSQQAGGEQ